MKVIYWGKYIDLYLIELFNHLESEIGESIDYVLVNERNFARKIQSNKLINPTKNRITLLRNKGFFKNAKEIIKDNNEAVHIFLSIWGEKRFIFIILYALFLKRKVMVIQEPYSESPYGYWADETCILSYIKIILRKLAYPFSKILFRAVSRGKLPCILAVSELAENQLVKANFLEETIFPFGYFISGRNITYDQYTKNSEIKLIFSGSLIKRKGLDIVIKALSIINTKETKIVLDIYGQCDIDNIINQKTKGIQYKGTYRQDDAQRTIAQYDILILPSHHDGWGLVVNEALLQNVPVIVSDRAGAKILVEHSGAGRVFEHENVQQLVDIFTEIFDNPTILSKMKDSCRIIRDIITPYNGALYMKKVMDYYFFNEGVRPEPFWMKKQI